MEATIMHAAAKLVIDLEMPDSCLEAPERMGLNQAQIDHLYPLLRVTFFAGYLCAKGEAERGCLGALERAILSA
jgi:hypothetical protein